MIKLCHPNWFSQRYWKRIGARLAAAREVSRLAHPNWTDPTWWRNALQSRQYGPDSARQSPPGDNCRNLTKFRQYSASGGRAHDDAAVDVVIDRDHRPRHRVTERFAERRSQSSWVSDLVRAARDARRGG
jgi:hypothetical protein